MNTVDKSTSELLDFNNKVVIVTGAGHGLGYEIARRFAEAGAAVVLNDRHTDRAQDAAAKLSNDGRKVIAAPGDISQRDIVESLLTSAIDNFQRVDVLVNNAGTWPMQAFLEASEDIWVKTLSVNLIGTLLCAQMVAKQLIEQDEGGSIINISSISAKMPLSDALIHYGASKAGVINATRTLAKALAPHRIRVNAVLPGGMETPGAARVSERRTGADIPLGYRAHPDEVALSVLFLASEMAAYVTGAELLVDGGATRNKWGQSKLFCTKCDM
jgi:2-dehydro-3-deoxy-D-gluconate 5-dehydrogenase